jgi:hypothetical protein
MAARATVVCLVFALVAISCPRQGMAQPVIPGKFISEAGGPKSQEAGYQVSVTPWSDAQSRYGVGRLVLYAIALQESGVHWTDGLVRPWPWVLNSPSTGSLYFRNKEEARTALRALLKRGERSIDVGIMQINLRANGWRVRFPEVLLDVNENIRVAAQILSEQLAQHRGDLKVAIARYHSPRDDLGFPYAESVLRLMRLLVVESGANIGKNR